MTCIATVWYFSRRLAKRRRRRRLPRRQHGNQRDGVPGRALRAAGPERQGHVLRRGGRRSSRPPSTLLVKLHPDSLIVRYYRRGRAVLTAMITIGAVSDEWRYDMIFIVSKHARAANVDYVVCQKPPTHRLYRVPIMFRQPTKVPELIRRANLFAY